MYCSCRMEAIPVSLEMRKLQYLSSGSESCEPWVAKSTAFVERKQLLRGLTCEIYCICRVEAILVRLAKRKLLYLSSGSESCEAWKAKSTVFVMEKRSGWTSARGDRLYNSGFGLGICSKCWFGKRFLWGLKREKYYICNVKTPQVAIRPRQPAIQFRFWIGNL